MIRANFSILVISNEEEEGALLSALLSSIKAPVDTELIGPFNPMLMENTYDCVLIDTRIYGNQAYANGVMTFIATEINRPTLVVHYGTDLEDPVVDARFRRITGFVSLYKVDRRKDTWIQSLLRRVEEHYWLLELDQVFADLRGKKIQPYAFQFDDLSDSSGLLAYCSLLGALIVSIEPDSRAWMLAKYVYGVLPEDTVSTVPLIVSSLTQPQKATRQQPVRVPLPNVIVKFWPEGLAGPKIRLFSERGRRFGAVLDRSIEEIKALLGKVDRLEAWLVPKEGDYIKLPFLHASDQKIALFLSDSLTQRSADYIAMHLALASTNRTRAISWAWCWESIAFWWASRRTPIYERLDPGRSISQLPNCSAGILFFAFLEQRFGLAAIQRLVESDSPDFWTAVSEATELRSTSLLVEFFRWSLITGCLPVSASGNSVVLDHCSAAAIRVPTAHLGFSLDRARAPNIVFCLLSHEYTVVASPRPSETSGKISIPPSCGYLLLVNVGQRSRDMNLLHDDGATVEIVWAKAGRMGRKQP